jgi:methyl-accepting chemotaxis protein
MVNDAGRRMQDIVTHVHQVAERVAAISAATAEQTAGIVQVNEAVSQLDQATQQNAALVEQSTAAATSLADQSRRLVDAVGAFRLA